MSVLRRGGRGGRRRYRYETIFRSHPPSDVLVFVNRVAMVEGRYVADATSATCYAWFVWREGAAGAQLHWLA